MVFQVVRFLQPTWLKLIFLLEWFLFILIILFQGQLDTSHQFFVVVYPLLLFYLAACLFTALGQKNGI